MTSDPYAVLRALLRAEALRNAPKPDPRPQRDGQPQKTPPKESARD